MLVKDDLLLEVLNIYLPYILYTCLLGFHIFINYKMYMVNILAHFSF